MFRETREAAKKMHAEVIVRITGDCPLVDPEVFDSVIELFHKKSVDYASNIDPPSFPDGLDVGSLLGSLTANNKATSKFDCEHVTPFIRNGDFVNKFLNSNDYSKFRLTLDEKADLELFNMVYNFAPNLNFNCRFSTVFTKNPISK